jgi:hypothetical protein
LPISSSNAFTASIPNCAAIELRCASIPSQPGIRVDIYSLDGRYLGTGSLHHRDADIPLAPEKARGKPRHSYTGLLIRQHKARLAEETGGIDYRKVIRQRPWPFHEFAKTVAEFLGRKAGLAGLSTDELESLKKLYNQSLAINRQMVKAAFEKAPCPSVPYIVRELKYAIRKEDPDVS